MIRHTSFCFYPIHLPLPRRSLSFLSLPHRLSAPSKTPNNPPPRFPFSQAAQHQHQHQHQHHEPHDSPMCPTKPACTPFSTFFTSYFQSTHPSIASHLRPHQTAHAAAVYLFRFCPRLSQTFISDTLSSIARSIADVSGKSLPESRRLFSTAARSASHLYFGHGWDNISLFEAANAPVLLALQKRHTKLKALLDEIKEGKAPEVDPVLLHALVEGGDVVVAFVFADYCSVCKATRPLFEAVAKVRVDGVRFVQVNGPRSPQVLANYHVDTYPSVLRIVGEDVRVFPTGAVMNQDAFRAFAMGDSVEGGNNGKGEDGSENEWGGEGEGDSSPRRAKAGRWAGVLKRQGIDEWDVLSNERSEILSSKIEDAILCSDNICKIDGEGRGIDVEKGEVPALCVLLGGGMGAGKTTAVNLVTGTEFWRKFGDHVVVVEADAFKMNDPLFQVLRSVTPLASRIVHHDSLVAAEELFVKAVNGRRDIVFDGTLSWSEYAKQTVDMLRDTMYLYTRGPGYQKGEDGEVTEKYWERTEKREKPVGPYRVELVGVTADAEISVMRGIVRRITDGRGVPVPDQLHSHALFSSNFEEYVDMVDAVYLFDTTMNSNIVDGKLGYADQLVAIKQGILFEKPPSKSIQQNESQGVGGFAIKDFRAYERFLMKKTLNVMASSTAELYQKTLAEG